MTTRLGKIAQLPKLIRHELNHRLENGKQGPEILEWLNALPETKDLIAQKFDNQPITRSNLSDWRLGGFKEWQADQLREARIQRVSETGRSLEKAETGDLFENFARMAVAELVADLDALQNLRGEKRAEKMRNLIRDLARLQNAYNRSRWAALAWTKFNGTENGRPAASPVRPEPPTPKPELPSPTSPVAPDRAPSQATPPDEGEPKPNCNGMYILHFTNCNCHEPCPKCHASDSDYPLDDAIRDHRYYRKHHEYPCDRHGKRRFLINVICDCPCDRCADQINGTPALPHSPITRPADLRDETPIVETTPTPPSTPEPHSSPIRPICPTPPRQLTDFARHLALLKTNSV